MSRRIRFEHAGTEPQMRFWQSAARWRAFVGGVGSGKTRAGAMEVLRQPAGSLGMIVAPTYPMLRDATMRTFFEVARPVIESFNKTEGLAVLADGKEVLFRSADNPDSLRGPNLGWFWLDEAALMQEEVWDVMIGRLRLGPGRAWLTTTPRGFNWVFDSFARAPRPDYELVRCSTRDNVFLPPGFVEQLESKYSSAFARQELDGDFLSLSDALVQPGWLRHGMPPSGLRVTMGVDLAISTRETADFTACVVVGTSSEGRRYVLDAVRTRAGFHEVLQFIQAVAQRWNPSAVFVEQVQYQAAVVSELLRKTSLPVRGIRPDRDKVTRFQPVAARYEQGLVIHTSGLPLDFERELLEFPYGRHDDFCDAQSLAFLGNPPAPFSVAVGGAPGPMELPIEGTRMTGGFRF